MISIKDRDSAAINRSLTMAPLRRIAFTETKAGRVIAVAFLAGVTIMPHAASWLFLSACLLAAAPAVAHPLPDSGAVFGRTGLETVFRSLEARGFYDLGPARPQRGAYRLTATEPRGQRVVVTVSARTGHILDIRVTHWTPAPARFGEVTILQPDR